MDGIWSIYLKLFLTLKDLFNLNNDNIPSFNFSFSSLFQNGEKDDPYTTICNQNKRLKMILYIKFIKKHWTSIKAFKIIHILIIFKITKKTNKPHKNYYNKFIASCNSFLQIWIASWYRHNKNHNNDILKDHLCIFTF